MIRRYGKLVLGMLMSGISSGDAAQPGRLIVKPLLRSVFISPVIPAGSGNGLAMRMGLFAEALSRISRLDVVVIPLFSATPGAEAFLQSNNITLHVLHTAGRRDTHFSLLSQIADEKQRLEAFRHYGRPSLCSALSRPVLDDISRIVEACEPDIIHIGRSYLTPCIDVIPRAAAMVDLDEDDLANFSSQARLALAAGRPAEAEWLRQEGIACDALIGAYGSYFQRICISNREDALRLSKRHGDIAVEVVENAVEIPYRASQRDDGETLVFIGSLAYPPNSDGLTWFARQVLPRIRAAGGADCRLLIAGSHPPASVRALGRHPRVKVLGWAPNLNELYLRATLALAPMRAGGGTRIKLLEAAAHGVASVSTRVACEGLNWPDKVGGWRADEAGDLAHCCQNALRQHEERRRRAESGLRWVRRRHARDAIVRRLSQSFATAVS